MDEPIWVTELRAAAAALTNFGNVAVDHEDMDSATRAFVLAGEVRTLLGDHGYHSE